MALSIKARLILMGTLLAFVPTVIVGLILSESALIKGSEDLKASANKQLIIARELTAQSIETYFTFIEDQVSSLAQNTATIAATREFRKAFSEYPSTTSATADEKLKSFYVKQFDAKFKQLNSEQSSNPDSLFRSLSPVAKSIQQTYISDNPAALGEKDHLTQVGDGSFYDQVHAQYHPTFRTFQHTFDFYDVFLVDAKSGDIIYSVFKEVDFGTSLLSGPYKNTAIAKAFNMAVKGQQPGATYLTDFSPYGPSYNSASAFTSSAIFDKGQLIGVLILQIPIDKIDGVMSHHKKWQESGLGNTGQTYIFGHDGIMRSNDRTLLEDKAAFFAKSAALNLPADTLEKINSRGTSIELLKVDSEAVQQAIEGKQGVIHSSNYFGDATLSAFRPLKIFGMDWVLISEMHEAEALESVAHLKGVIFTNLAIVSVIALVVGALLGLLLAKVIVKPIDTMVDLMHDIAEGGGDLTQRLPEKGKDELAQLAKGINSFTGHIDTTFSTVLSSVVRLKPISGDMADVNSELAAATEQQKVQADKVNVCLAETNESTQQVERELKQIGQATKEGNVTVQESGQVVLKVADVMSELAVEISLAVEALSSLKDDTDRIAGIIDVINGIAEQTNLLALNAAIEAARAGEAGRGFAVVADEVRTLASKTRQSTDEVAEMVDAIQGGTQKVVQRMEKSKENASRSSDYASQATDSLTSIKAAMETISDRVKQIDLAVHSQQQNFLEVTSHYDGMRQSFVRINEQTQHSGKVGEDVIKLADNIMDNINRFKVTDNNWSTNRRNRIREEDAS